MEDLGLRAFYQGRKVFVTGHTGFKGAWLAWWLVELGAHVTGYALAPQDRRGNLFKLSGLAAAVRSVEGDIDDLTALRRALDSSGADLVLHLAAQPIVLAGYDDPVGTYRTNAQGTVHLLEAARLCQSVRSIVVVTTDKCYENKERSQPYCEGDELGGQDPYSSSKAMAELAVSAYRRSFLAQRGVGLASARAGNVIGGGDYAQHRIIPDIVDALAGGRPVVLRNPAAVRPWQHVLDALHGYLRLAQRLSSDPVGFSEPFNFSPDDTGPQHHVLGLAEAFVRHFGRGVIRVDEASRRGHEAAYLSLDPTKARRRLGWRQQLGTDEAIRLSAAWYADVMREPACARARTLSDIRQFMQGGAHV